eukprot:412930_1
MSAFLPTKPLVIRPETFLYGVGFGWVTLSFLPFDLPFLLNKADKNKAKYYIQRNVAAYTSIAKTGYFNKYEILHFVGLFGIMGYRAYQTRHIGDISNVSVTLLNLPISFLLFKGLKHLETLKKAAGFDQYLPEYEEENDDNKAVIDALTFIAKSHIFVSLLMLGNVGLSIWAANTKKPL